MRVLYITNGFFGSNEANMVQSHNSVAALCQINDVREVTFVGYSPAVIEEADLLQEHAKSTGSEPSTKLNFRVLHLGQQSWLKTLLKLRRLLHDINFKEYDLIYTRSRDALVLFYLSGFSKFKYEAHNLEVPGSAYKRLLYRLGIRRGDMQIVCITQSLENDFANLYGLPKSRLRLIPCAARLPSDVLDSGCRKYVVFCGSDYPGKGLHEFVQLARDNPTQQFLALIRTSGHAEKLGLDALPNLIIRYNADNSTVYRALADCHIALAPYSSSATTSGGMSNARYISPLKVFEYMALGCLIVASDLTAIKEVIQHRRNGLLYKADDYPALKAVFQEAIAAFENGTAVQMIANAKADFEAKYSYDARARMMLDPLPSSLSTADHRPSLV
jgi:glycosyltransferase involved in cell wall biosynthesis